ncbi:phosphate ABC transporter permease subunit PstC [Clostridium cochlearium]|uniref:phosphate ABC transporter permease subunit PstC n=1 Tax=Clostridium cochlearium TaxID=1494 RepID=UPI0014593035|nr:phosphate ABC transporter permease subunit PstC [Clostridium cochlearium]NME96184.1 phosphate ABC transporter permease subunit PstC [Clostridium cochlearium]
MEKVLISNKLNINKTKLFIKFKNEYMGRMFSTLCGIFMVAITFSIILFIFSKGIKIFLEDGYSLKEFIFSSSWNPDGENPSFGSSIFIIGSILVSIGAILIATPISIALAIFMNHISPKLGKNFLKPALELFVGIPSVVYGWIGIVLFIPIIKRNFGGLGFSLFAGMLVLSIMVLPTIASISSDAIKSIPKDYVEASLALGATRWQTIKNVILPVSMPQILTGIILAGGRIFGEAAALLYTSGMSAPPLSFSLQNIFSANSPFNPMRPAETLAVYIWQVNSEGMIPDATKVGNASSAVLIIMVLIFNIMARIIGNIIHRKYVGEK